MACFTFFILTCATISNLHKHYQARVIIDYMYKKSVSEGFTIVELLIVIVVIAVLTSITVVAYNGIQSRSRDAKRRDDIGILERALEAHYISKGSFTQPEAMCSDTSYGGLGACGDTSPAGDWAPNSDLRDLITDGIMNKLPVDPINNATYNYNYEPLNLNEAGYTAAGMGYNLCARLEVGGNYCVNRRT